MLMVASGWWDHECILFFLFLTIFYVLLLLVQTGVICVIKIKLMFVDRPKHKEYSYSSTNINEPSSSFVTVENQESPGIWGKLTASKRETMIKLKI